MEILEETGLNWLAAAVARGARPTIAAESSPAMSEGALADPVPGQTPPTLSSVPAFSDNYIWVVHGITDPARVAVIDPGDGNVMVKALTARGLRLEAILVTHHHPDHCGGVPELTAQWPVPVYAPARETVAGRTVAVAEGDAVELPTLGLRFGVLDIPGHTAGHIAFYGHQTVFCGDTLFSAGCGRLFEGTPAQMTRSLERLGALPVATRVCCGHEYTAANLRFAQVVEPANEAIARQTATVARLRERGEPSLPSTIGLERAINPFLRVRAETVRASASRHAGRELSDPVEVFATVRTWKDGFKG
jgi:hydroxyacylglutathione hydrolase